MLFCEAFIQECSHTFDPIAGTGSFAVVVENSKEGEAMFFQVGFGGNGVSKTPEDLGAVSESWSGRPVRKAALTSNSERNQREVVLWESQSLSQPYLLSQTRVNAPHRAVDR
jgi:hypothetical protein